MLIVYRRIYQSKNKYDTNIITNNNLWDAKSILQVQSTTFIGVHIGPMNTWAGQTIFSKSEIN